MYKQSDLGIGVGIDTDIDLDGDLDGDLDIDIDIDTYTRQYVLLRLNKYWESKSQTETNAADDDTA